MNFLQHQQNDGPPQLEASGVLNLSDWTMPQGHSMFTQRDTVTLPDGTRVNVSQAPNMPSREILSLSDEDLSWVANQGAFPEVWCVLFLRRLTDEIRAIAPMLSLSQFYAEHKEFITKTLTENLETDEAAEWVDYYASALREFPIFRIALNHVDVKYQEQIGESYLQQFNDIKYLTGDQVNNLTTEDKLNFLITTMKESQNDPGKRDISIGLFTSSDILSAADAARVLALTNSSVTCGALMACPPFYDEHDNAYNTVATWIRHCVNEKIGTNQSVWYKQAQDIEFQHKFALSGQYIKNVQGQAIGGINTSSSFGDTQLVKSYNGNLGKPIGL